MAFIFVAIIGSGLIISISSGQALTVSAQIFAPGGQPEQPADIPPDESSEAETPEEELPPIDEEPIDPCFDNPNLPECQPPADPCFDNPNLPECQPPADPCFDNPKLPECQPPVICPDGGGPLPDGSCPPVICPDGGGPLPDGSCPTPSGEEPTFVPEPGEEPPPALPIFDNIPGGKEVEETFSTIVENTPFQPILIIGVIALVAIGGGVAAYAKHSHSRHHQSTSINSTEQENDTKNDETIEDVEIITRGGIEKE